MIKQTNWKRQRLLAAMLGIAIFAPAIGNGADAELSTEEQISPRKIREAGEKKDRSKIQQLRRIKAKREKTRHSEAYDAQVSLAKMGEKAEIDEIIAETKSDDPAVQFEAIKKLEYVGNKQAVRALIDLLGDMRIRRGLPEKGPDGKMRESDVGFGPPSYSSMKALKKLIPEGPGFKGKHPTKADADAWKEWWKTNKQKYQ